jgi:tetratricopeptide (TPR) repeat protein
MSCQRTLRGDVVANRVAGLRTRAPNRFGLGLLIVALGCGDTGPDVQASAADVLAARTAGLTYLQQDRLEEATVEFERLIRLAPREAAGYASLALVHLRGGDLAEAERQIRRALEIEPDSPEHRLTLSRILEVAGRPGEARVELEASAEQNPDHLRTQWALAEWTGGAALMTPNDRVGRLERIVEVAPGNLAARLQLVQSLLETDTPDLAVEHLEALRQQAPDFPDLSLSSFDLTVEAARTGREDEAISQLADFRRYFEVTSPYQAGMADLRGPAGTLTGIPQLGFSYTFSLRIQEEEAVLAALRYTDASTTAGLLDAGAGSPTPADAPDSGGVGAVLALGDYDGDRDEDLYATTGVSTGGLLRGDLGRFVEPEGGPAFPDIGPIRDARFGDYDDDRRLDLFLVGEIGSALLHNEGDGRFAEATMLGSREGGLGHRALFVDLDLDGDLDLFEARQGPNRFYRNNGDGSFEERASMAGIAGPADSDSRGVAFADFDDDRDVDLVVVSATHGVTLYSNARAARFEDLTSESGLPVDSGFGSVAVGDYDNDGWIDLFLAGADGETSALYRNLSGGGFELDERTVGDLAILAGLEVRDAVFLDFDNDGQLDLAVGGRSADPEAAGLRLLRNEGDGRFADAGRFLPEVPAHVTRTFAADYNEDGDLDLFLALGDGSVRLLRNDGGNGNHYLRLDLIGLGEGSRKNNRFGIGARVEVRTGDLLQVRVADRPYLHFGLDGRLKADVIRVEWPNGVAQDLYFPGTDQDLVEQQTLKGSCPFLYAWDGDSYEFVTDVLWRSALGMPMGILGGTGERAFAPGYPSQQYVRIPPDALRPGEDGSYSIQLTEELWEAVYIDEVKLLTVDHPDSVEMRVDETFRPPAPESLRLYRVDRPHPVRAATDERGNDLLSALAAPDHEYVSNLRPGRFQGITQMHDLILDLGNAARADSVVLYLNGWIFPTDASINVAMSQSSAGGTVFPYLQVRDASGNWQTVIEDLGIPAGKNKTVVADLSGRFLSEDRSVRIRTSAQLYWDHAFFTTGTPGPGEGEAVVTELSPSTADLHYRGFSREYRLGGPDGPHWFDYASVTTEPRWSDLLGLYTRYGDVTPLLQRPDDMYVITNAGDEVTISFRADDAPFPGAGPLPVRAGGNLPERRSTPPLDRDVQHQASDSRSVLRPCTATTPTAVQGTSSEPGCSLRGFSSRSQITAKRISPPPSI